MANKPVHISTGIVLLLAAAVIMVSSAILQPWGKAALAYERGSRAQEEGRHSTAIKEFKKVLEQFPDSVSTHARLAIAYFQNERFNLSREHLNLIAGKEVSGKLSRQVNSIVIKLDEVYYENAELSNILRLYGSEELDKTAFKLNGYLSGVNKNDIMGIFHLANINFDMGKYREAEELYKRIIELQPEFYSAYLNLAAVYRENGRLELAAECCNRVLLKNKEHPQAYAALSRIELRERNDKTALEHAEKAFLYDGSDPYIVSNLSLVYHYNNMTAERDKLFEQLKKNNYYDISALQSAFAGELDLR